MRIIDSFLEFVAETSDSSHVKLSKKFLPRCQVFSFNAILIIRFFNLTQFRSTAILT